jgi:hypothetical protein
LEYLADQIPVKLPNLDSEDASEERLHEKHTKSGDVKDSRKGMYI